MPYVLSGRVLAQSELATFVHAGINIPSIGAIWYSDSEWAALNAGSLADVGVREPAEASADVWYSNEDDLESITVEELIPTIESVLQDPVSALDPQQLNLIGGTTPLDLLDPLALFHEFGETSGGLITPMPTADEQRIIDEALGGGSGALGSGDDFVTAGGTALALRGALDIIRRAGVGDDVIRIYGSSTGTRTLRDAWASLTTAQRTALASGAAGAGLALSDLLDFPFDLGLIGFGGGPSNVNFGPGVVLTPGWVANGVQFYYVNDGRLAVQNKRGRWKFWRPKKPIVLFANGAADIRTMLRADKALDKQAKQLKSMLNRRAGTPRRRGPAKHTHHEGGSVSVVNVD